MSTLHTLLNSLNNVLPPEITLKIYDYYINASIPVFQKNHRQKLLTKEFYVELAEKCSKKHKFLMGGKTSFKLRYDEEFRHIFICPFLLGNGALAYPSYLNAARRNNYYLGFRGKKDWTVSERCLSPKTGQIIKKNPTKLSNAQIQREHQNLPPNSAK